MLRQKAKRRKVLDKAGALLANVRFHRWKTDRIWTRDSGCIYVEEAGKLRALHLRFNAWAKYPNYAHDAKLGALMAVPPRRKRLIPRKTNIK